MMAGTTTMIDEVQVESVVPAPSPTTTTTSPISSSAVPWAPHVS